MHAASFDAAVLSHVTECDSIRLLTVQWDDSTPAPKAGQFYMLRAWAHDEAPLLPRPISVHSFDAQSGALAFQYEVKGKGTEKIAALQEGDSLQITGPSGNGFPVEQLAQSAKTADKPVALVGGGIGTAPLLQLARELTQQGAQVHFYGGYRTMAFGVDELLPLCERVEVATESGACGYKGYVTDLLDPRPYSAVCTCGPEIMMQKVARICAGAGVPVWVSKEAKMACGLGACLGCTCKASKKEGEKPVSVCKDGPVFEGGSVYELD